MSVNEAANTKKVTLKSSDGETFDVDQAVAVESQTIKHMIEDDCADNKIPLPNVTSKILAKGTLRDLTKGGRNLWFDKNEQGTLVDTKALTMVAENVFAHTDEQETPEGGTLGSRNPTLNADEQEISDDLTKPFPVRSENPSAEVDEQRDPVCGLAAQSLWGDLRALSSHFWDLQETPNDLPHVSTTEIERSGNTNVQRGANGSHMASY